MLSELDKQMIREKLLSIWEEYDCKFQQIAHRRIPDQPIVRKRRDLESKMTEIERVMEMLKSPNVAVDKLELEGVLR